MSDHRAIVADYLKAQFPNAAIIDGHDTEHYGHWWSVKEGETTMALRVSQEFLTYQSEHEAGATLNNFNPAKALRGSVGRVVVLTRGGLMYVPEVPHA